MHLPYTIIQLYKVLQTLVQQLYTTIHNLTTQHSNYTKLNKTFQHLSFLQDYTKRLQNYTNFSIQHFTIFHKHIHTTSPTSTYNTFFTTKTKLYTTLQKSTAYAKLYKTCNGIRTSQHCTTQYTSLHN